MQSCVICLFLVKISQLTGSCIIGAVCIFVIALLIASHEMNYKIIGMLFILLHVLCVCVTVVCCTCITYQLKCVTLHSCNA